MYSNKENVNILTALLVKWGVKQVVVCPGSRNAPIVHNFNECPDIACFPVTDERSAGFFALGLSQVDDTPVAVCVTSGSALLNVAPAVVEAFYQHRKLIVISADRPAAMIGQLQGQTMPQAHALRDFVRKEVCLPEPHDDTERWYCNRLVNEALIEMGRGDGGPVHINVPISEPLFDFSVEALPDDRTITLWESESDVDMFEDMVKRFVKAKRPMILIGQSKLHDVFDKEEKFERLMKYAVVLYEKLGNDDGQPPRFIDEMLIRIEGDEDNYLPDFIIYMGDTFVSNRLKGFLRKCAGVPTVVVNADAEVRDVTTHVTDIVRASVGEAIEMLWPAVVGRKPTAFQRKWEALWNQCLEHCLNFVPPYSQMEAVRQLFINMIDVDCEYHFANSMAVRLGIIYANQYLYVNRGVNGIEGSLSTAVGYALNFDQLVCCTIGDLSFFYDQNALWNNCLTSNLRILLLNNGGGGIFRGLPGLKESAAREKLIAAAHQTTAEGICHENGLRYIAAHNMEELEDGMAELANVDSMVPILLEVFTDPDEDDRVYNEYLYGEKKQMN